MKTQAVVCRQPSQPFVIEEVDLPEVGSGEVLVRIVATASATPILRAATDF